MTVIILFMLCITQLVSLHVLWPMWLGTFCNEAQSHKTACTHTHTANHKNSTTKAILFGVW